MRTKATLQGSLSWDCPSSVRVVREYRAKYAGIEEVLRANPKLVSLAHRDWCEGLSVSRRGRKGDYTSEEILRSLIVHFVEDDSYRDLVIRVENSDFLRGFVGLGFKPMMDYTFLCKAFWALSAETVEAMNEVVKQYARREGKISGERLRVDTTVVETNIHYPTDSSLLWDSFRTLLRLLRRHGAEMRGVGLRPRFHKRKVKGLAYFIGRNSKSESKRKQQRVKKAYKTLIERVGRIAGVAREAMKPEFPR